MAEIDLDRTTRGALIKSIYANTADKVQQTKLYAADEMIRYLQSDAADNIMPPDSQIISYVTSTTPKNRYPNYARFRRVMAASPKYAPKNFYFVGSTGDAGLWRTIQEAAKFATDLVQQRTRMYPKSTAPDSPHQSTGYLYNHITTFVEGSQTNSYEQEIQRVGETGQTPTFEIANIAEYATTAEARSYYYRVGGIIWYAANRVQRKYPQLGVYFGYSASVVAQGMAGYGHVFGVPLLRIGHPDVVKGAWVRPGQNQRKRVKRIRQLKRIFDDGT